MTPQNLVAHMESGISSIREPSLGAAAHARLATRLSCGIMRSFDGSWTAFRLEEVWVPFGKAERWDFQT